MSDLHLIAINEGRTSTPVSTAIHPKDGMYKGNAKHYQSCGESAMFNIALACLSGGLKHPRAILDYACGFGRVARRLRAALPDAEFTFADTMPDAASFCAEAFAGRACSVDQSFSGLPEGATFDLIWVGSLFTHLAAEGSRNLFRILYSRLQPNGLLVFSTHGVYVRSRRSSGTWPYNITAEQYDELIEDADTMGYGFVEYSGMSNYGISLSTMAWWMELFNDEATSVVFAKERAWDNHQDVLAVQKRG